MCCPLINILFDFRWHYCYHCFLCNDLLSVIQSIPNPFRRSHTPWRALSGWRFWTAATKPEDATGLEDITTGSHTLWRCPSLALRIQPMPSAPLLRVPYLERALPALTPIRALQMVVFRNELTVNVEFQYQAQIVGSMDLDLHGDKPKITKLWIMYVTHSRTALNQSRETVYCKWNLSSEYPAQNWSRPLKAIKNNCLQHLIL